MADNAPISPERRGYPDPAGDIRELQQRAQDALASGRLDLAEVAVAEHFHDAQALVEDLRIHEAELRLQNEDLRQSRALMEELLSRFSALFHALPAPCLILDSRGVICDANAAAERQFDLRPSTYRHRFFSRVVGRSRRGEFVDALGEAARVQPVVLEQIELRVANADPLVGDLHLSTLPSHRVSERELICTFIDRTEAFRQRERLEQSLQSLTQENAARRRAENASRAHEERARLALEATNDGIWDFDVRSQQVTVNDRYYDMLGYSAGEIELSAESLIELVHPQDRTRVQASFQAHVTAGAPYAVELRMRCKDGRWRWLQSRGRIVERDANGQPLRVVGTNTEIHERKLAEQARHESLRRLREAERLAALGHWEYRVDGSAFLWSEQLYRIFGFDPGAEVPQLDELAQYFHPDDRGEFIQRFRRLLNGSECEQFLLRIDRRDGGLRWLFSEGRAVRDASGQVARCFGTAQDVTERELAQERLRVAASVFESTADAVMVIAEDHRIITVNPAFTRITGYPREAVDELELEAVLISAADHRFWEGLEAGIQERGHWQGEGWEQRQDGTLYRARLSVRTVSGERCKTARYVVALTDVTRLYETREQINFLSNYDSLTGLVNRSCFYSRLTRALQQAERSSDRLAILILDVDRFRVVNESIGPAAADQLLKQIAEALHGSIRPEDTIARIGGDEFGIILPGTDSTETIAEMVDRLQRCCAQRRVVDGQTITVTASVGVAGFPLDGLSSDLLMRHATIALKQAKSRGRQQRQYFQPSTGQACPDRLHLEACLSQALLSDELSLHYQPQVSLSDGRLVGAEALLRWQSPELGPVSPQQFIPIAEDMGLILDIGVWVLRKAAKQLAAWDSAGLRLPRLAVNLSILQLEDSDLADEIAGILKQHGLTPGRLDLELTESLIMRQAGQALLTLEALQQIGVRLAIDDFGTGYSSLASLHRLPVHQLKIDRSFVDPLPDDVQSQTITNAIIALGSSLGLDVLAEGVETAEQAVWLKNAGCHLVQGYHYSRPLPADAFVTEWL